MKIASRFLKNVLFFLTLNFLSGAVTLFAYEVDNFTGRDKLEKDSLEILDNKVNVILERAVKETNKESPDRCNAAILRQEIVRWTRPELVSLLEMWVMVTDELDRTNAGVASSIYSGVTIDESIAMWTAGIGRSFKLNGVVVGTDKLGHFFMQGLDYFKRNVEDRKSIDEILANENGEDGAYGLLMTGVKSYGDMAANFSGYRFWKNLYLGNNPYFKCEDGKKWVKNRTFSWAEYVNAAWDEAINCSEFSESLAKRVNQNLRKIGMQCPVSENQCQKIRFLEKAQYYVSPACMTSRHQQVVQLVGEQK